MNPALRQELADALSTVDGVRGFAKKPSAYKSGDGWPLWSGAERWEGSGMFVSTWRVFVALPTDEVAADTWIADRFELLIDVLQPVAHVDQVEIVRASAVDASPILQFTVRE